LRRQPSPPGHQSAQLRRRGKPVHLLLRHDEEADRMDWKERARRQDGPLHALLPPQVQEAAEIGEVAELLAIGRRLRADRKALTALRDDDADLARGHLTPRELLAPVEDAELPAQARHEQVRLIARLSLERDRIVVAETARRHALRHETDLGRPDRME